MSRALMCTACGALALAANVLGCGQDQPISATDRGSVQVALQASAGIAVDRIQYTITGNELERTGALAAPEGSSFSGVIAGIPAGSAYTLELSGRAGTVSCEGSTQFDVIAGQTTNVSIVVKCRNEEPRGTLMVNGRFDLCPVIGGVSASPAAAAVGQPIQLHGQASDEDDDRLTFLWSAQGGSLGDPSALDGTFTCAAPGLQTLTLEVRDGADCADSISVDVQCGAPAGDAGVGPDGGSSGDAGAGTDTDAGAAGDAGSADAAVPPDTSSDAGAGPSADAGGSTSGIPVTGTWIARIQTAGTIEAPVVGSVGANIDLVARIVVTESGGGLQEQLEICRLQTVSTPNASALAVSYPPAVIATLSDTQAQQAFSAAIGAPFPVPGFTILSGMDAAGQAADEDGDGNPGVTLPTNIGGLLAIDAYVGLNMMTGFTADLTAADTITGTTAFTVSGTVFGSNNPVLSSGSINVTPSSSAVPVTAQRVDGDVPCSSALSMFP